MKKSVILYSTILFLFLFLGGVSWGQMPSANKSKAFFDSKLSFRSLKEPTHYIKKGGAFISPTLKDLIASRDCLYKNQTEGEKCLDKISSTGGLMIFKVKSDKPIFVRVLETYSFYALIKDMEGDLMWTFNSSLEKIPHPLDKFQD